MSNSKGVSSESLLPSAPPLDEKEHLLPVANGNLQACELCKKSQADWDMIRPCVQCEHLKMHRACLDMWRTVAPHDVSACLFCNTPFEFEQEADEPKSSSICSPTTKFALAVTRDLVLLLGTCIGIAFFFGLVIVPAMDPTNHRVTILPRSWSLLAVNIFWGFVSFFALVAVAGITAMVIRLLGHVFSCCCQCCYSDGQPGYERNYSYNSYPYYDRDIYCLYFWYPIPTPPLAPPHMAPSVNHRCCDCNSLFCCSSCGHHDCGGGDSDNGALILMIIVLVLAAIGLVMSLVFLAFLGASFVNKYRQLLQKSHQIARRRVKDMSLKFDAQNTIQMI